MISFCYSQEGPLRSSRFLSDEAFTFLDPYPSRSPQSFLFGLRGCAPFFSDPLSRLSFSSLASAINRARFPKTFFFPALLTPPFPETRVSFILSVFGKPTRISFRRVRFPAFRRSENPLFYNFPQETSYIHLKQTQRSFRFHHPTKRPKTIFCPYIAFLFRLSPPLPNDPHEAFHTRSSMS